MICPTDAELLALIEGNLTPAARTGAEVHLDACPSCLAIVAALAQTSAAPGGDGEPGPLAAPGPLLPDGQPRYVPGAEIARGGMGRILIAEDRLLGRTVALKLLRRSSESLTRRFLREQRVTARLQHPAIIPIHDAGVLPGGEPFFAMRLVKGEDLERTAARARSLEARLRLLPSLLGVVDAVAYAHGEGVVHRDLKPQNVLVGPFGEVVVVDWGLARELGAAPEGGDEVRSADAGALASGPPGGEPAATRDGEVLGTLAYMAPEQARGSAADARSDVYGLGAILYHVLAGAPPHAGRGESLSIGALLHAPEPLGQRVPDVPADLVAIVERAMAREPEARYASAQELAEDLKRWQAGRLVAAHRYSPGDLLRRFARRYRAPLLVAGAALVVLVGLGGVALRRVVAERTRALAEQARAESQRSRAEAQRVAAEALVGFILGDLRGRLERVGRLDALEGVARAVTAYQEGSPPAEDAAAAARRSGVAGLAGDVAFALGNLDAADESYERSRRAAEEAGAGELAAEARCRAALRLGDVRKRRGDLDAATSFYDACAALARSAPGPIFRDLSVRSSLALAEMARIRGELPAARRLLEEARPVAVALVEEAGGPGADAARLLLTLRRELVQTLFTAGEVAAARDEAQATVALARARRSARPDDADARYDAGTALALLGLPLQLGGDLMTPEPLYREALEEHRALAARDPSNVQWQHAISVDTDRMGALMKLRGDTAAALLWLRESDAASVRVAAIAPGNLEWQRDLFLSAITLSDALSDLGRLDEARAEVQRAIAIQERLRALAPGAGRAAHELGSALLTLGELELKAHRIAAGQGALRRGIAELRAYLDTADAPAVRQDLVNALTMLAESEHGVEAAGHIAEALEVLAPLRPLATSNSTLQGVLEHTDEVARKARARR